MKLIYDFDFLNAFMKQIYYFDFLIDELGVGRGENKINFHFRPYLGHIYEFALSKKQREDPWVKFVSFSKKFSELNGNIFKI